VISQLAVGDSDYRIKCRQAPWSVSGRDRVGGGRGLLVQIAAAYPTGGNIRRLYLSQTSVRIHLDATIINDPSSTMNQDKARDPAMHQTKKGHRLVR
jgi:hypothetical protein